MNKIMDAVTVECLYKYVRDFVKDKDCVKRISHVILEQPRRSMTVYRGQGKTPRIDRARIDGFLSTSKSERAAREGFVGKHCCFFKIHVKSDVPSLDVYKFINKASMADEEEVLLPEGGYFYKDAALTKEGFTSVVDGNYETWYTMRPPTTVTRPLNFDVQRALKIIDPDEYEFIESAEDIHLDVPIDIKKAMFEEIRKLKGGRRSGKNSGCIGGEQTILRKKYMRLPHGRKAFTRKRKVDVRKSTIKAARIPTR